MSLEEQSGTRPGASFSLVETQEKRGPIVSVSVDVTPQKKEDQNGDIILLGHVGTAEVEVVFKRSEAMRPLLTRLTQLLRAARARSVASGDPVPHAADLRIPLEVHGAWRVRLQFDEDDMPVRHYQLLAARWRMRFDRQKAEADMQATGT